MSGADRDAALRTAAGRLTRKRSHGVPSNDARPLWDASFFKLDQVDRFRAMATADRHRILEDCGCAILKESWHIERCGIRYCARMTLSAESDNEQRMFALIGADEALHASWLEPWVDATDTSPDVFDRFIEGIAESGAPQPSAYILQVVLEGFGITHYDALASNCQDTGLAATLRVMAEDEALHHAGGLATFDAARFTDADRRFCAEASYAFLQMIRCGPQRVVAAIDHAIGVRDQADAARWFDALDTEVDTAAKLNRLRTLMSQPGMTWLIEQLHRGGAFEPCTPVDCAQIYAGIR